MRDRCAVLVACADTHALVRFGFDRPNARLAVAGRQMTAPGMPPSHQSIPLAVSPDARWLYAASRSDPYLLSSYRLDSSGELALAATTALSWSVAYIGVDRVGNYLLAVSYPASCLVVLRIDECGLVAGRPTCVRSDILRAHSFVLSNDNDIVYVAELGRDRVVAFAFNAQDGRLSPTPVGIAQLRAGTGARHLALDTGGRHLYCLNETDASIDVLTILDEGRTLQSLQTVWMPDVDASVPNQRAADIHLSPDGRHLYASERNRSTLATFDVMADGTLQPVDVVPTEACPRSFAVDPAGTCLVVAGQVSGHVSVHCIDPRTGVPSTGVSYPASAGASWVEFIEIASQHRQPGGNDASRLDRP